MSEERKLPRATQQQWHDFAESILWLDLKDFMEDSIQVNRDILEGIYVQRDPEELDAIRGRCREIRRIIEVVEGWATGKIPITEL